MVYVKKFNLNCTANARRVIGMTLWHVFFFIAFFARQKLVISLKNGGYDDDD